MNRCFILSLMFVVALIASAQFRMTADGMVASDGNQYIVEKIHGSQSQLFQRTKTVLTSMLKTADYELKSNEPDIIIISCEGLKVTKDYLAGLKDKYSTTWTLEIKFKPNRIRIDAPVIDNLKCRRSVIKPGKGSAIGVSSGLNREGHLFKEDGSAREEEMIKQIDDYFNEFIGGLIDSVKNYESSDDNKW